MCNILLIDEFESRNSAGQQIGKYLRQVVFNLLEALFESFLPLFVEVADVGNQSHLIFFEDLLLAHQLFEVIFGSLVVVFHIEVNPLLQNLLFGFEFGVLLDSLLIAKRRGIVASDHL